MDLAAGGDTLITPLAMPALAFVDLVTGAVDTVHIVPDTGTADFIGSVRTTADRKAFAFGSRTSGAASPSPSSSTT